MAEANSPNESPKWVVVLGATFLVLMGVASLRAGRFWEFADKSTQAGMILVGCGGKFESKPGALKLFAWICLFFCIGLVSQIFLRFDSEFAPVWQPVYFIIGSGFLLLRYKAYQRNTTRSS